VGSHLLDRHARYERDVAGDERQNARRDERQEPCRKRRDERDVRVHQSRFCSWMTTGSVPASGRPSNFTGGRSWNMSAHLQRWDEVESCRQGCAGTGRGKARSVSLANIAWPAIACPASDRTWALLV